MEPTEQKRGRGRPRTVPEGRGNTLTITINPHTRAALEAASAKLGRSLSQTAEQAIERGRMVGDLGAAGAAIADVLQTMVRTAAEVGRTSGDPTASVEARDELRRRWVKVAQEALPNVEYAPAAVQAAQAAVSAMRFAAMDAFEIYIGRLSDREVPDATAGLLRRISLGQLYPGLPKWEAAKNALEAASVSDSADIAGSIKTLLAIADGAERAVERAEHQQ